MNQTELSYFVVLVIVILLSQFAPTKLLMLLDHLVIRMALVLLLLYLMRVGPTAGIFGLMAIAILYLERNRRKIAEALLKIDKMDSAYTLHHPQATVEEASQPQKTVPVIPFDVPESFETDFLPTEASDSAFFEPVAETINQKAVLSTIYPSGSPSASESLYEKLGFGHVDGVTTLGSQ
uniref:Uncharacterized protein n=1 Tax=viral metagenome TaxID=1070528 RepID=A0A6C0IHX5_9ZZZZ